MVELLNKTNYSAETTEVFNSLITKVKSIFETSRVEVEYSGETIVKARMFYYKTIPAYLFYQQPLTSFELYHSNITEIGDYAFYNARLTNFSIPNTVQKIGKFSFCECPLKDLEIPNSVTSIDDSAFCGISIRELNIPSSVTFIGSRAFFECGSLKKVTLPDTPVELESDVFARCGLTTFDFPEWLVDIPTQMFYCCYSLRLSSLPYGIKSIGNGAFQATACTFTQIPDSVTKIGNSAFVGIPSTTLTIPNSVTTVGTCLLAGSAKINTLRIYCNLPNSVISNNSNLNTTLKYVEIGGNVKPYAFRGCTGLLKVWIRESCTTIETSSASNDRPFYNNSNLTIYVETDSKPEGWAENFNQISSSKFATVIYGVKESPF